MLPTRRTTAALLLACVVCGASARAGADDPAVPLRLQVDLTVKLIPYAKQPAVRLADLVRIGILIKSGNAVSARFGAELRTAFDNIETIAGRPHEQTTIQWSGPADLTELCRRRKLLVLYLTPALDSEVPSIARALEGIQVVTIAATDSYVSNGAVLGFELVSGHPKMVFNVGQARKQNVVFGSAVMKLMRIVE